MENSLFQSFIKKHKELLEFFLFSFFPFIIWIKFHNKMMMDVIF